MHLDDLISEFIGSLANMAIKNDSHPLTKDDFLDILRIAQIENPKGENYKIPKGSIDKAIKYWEEKDRASVVNNIKTILQF